VSVADPARTVRPPIRTVVFDVGGVLVTNPLEEFAKLDADQGLREGTAMSLFRGGSLFAECETGRLPFTEFCTRSVAQIRSDQGIDVPVERLAAMMDAIMGRDTVDEQMRALVIELKTAGLEIGLLSNIYRELDDWLRNLFPEGVVDVFCPSYLVGLRKPDPAIYRTLIEMSGRLPAEVAFVDDFEENVAAAVAAGMVGILFTSEAALQARLRELYVGLS
jgi:HAD superfamily hydrolase (TIGR01509 family)